MLKLINDYNLHRTRVKTEDLRSMRTTTFPRRKWRAYTRRNLPKS